MTFHQEGTGIEKHNSKLTLNPHESTDTTSRFYLLNQDLKMENWTHVPHALSLPWATLPTPLPPELSSSNLSMNRSFPTHSLPQLPEQAQPGW